MTFTYTLDAECVSVSEWVSSFLTAHQHIKGYSVPHNGLENAIKDEKYNQGYLAKIKYEKRII